MTRALWPLVFGSHLGEQRVVVDDFKERILQIPIRDLPYYRDLKRLQISEAKSALDLLSQRQKNPLNLHLLVAGRNIRGMATRSNLVQAISAERSKEKLTEFCTPLEQFITINESDNVAQALRLFRKHAFKSLPVIGEKKEIVSVLTRAQLLNWLADQLLGT